MPLPLSRPVILVVRVIAGVVVLFATVPAKPLALTTLTLVTVPDDPALLVTHLTPVPVLDNI